MLHKTINSTSLRGRTPMNIGGERSNPEVRSTEHGIACLSGRQASLLHTPLASARNDDKFFK